MHRLKSTAMKIADIKRCTVYMSKLTYLRVILNQISSDTRQDRCHDNVKHDIENTCRKRLQLTRNICLAALHPISSFPSKPFQIPQPRCQLCQRHSRHAEL